MGRPPKAAGEAKSRYLQVRVNPDEKKPSSTQPLKQLALRSLNGHENTYAPHLEMIWLIPPKNRGDVKNEGHRV